MGSEPIQNSLRVYDVHKGNFSREFVEKISSEQDEPQWMRSRRLDAYKLYESLPMPHTTSDDVWRRNVSLSAQDYWRRTARSMRGLKLEEFHPIALSPNGNTMPTDTTKRPYVSNTLEAQIQSHRTSTAGVIGLQDSLVVEYALSKDLVRKGVYFADINTALRERPDFVRSYFMTKAVTIEWNGFDALHGAFWQGGYLLHVPKGVVVEIPLRVFIALSESHRADLAHSIIVADDSSQITIVEEQLSADDTTPGLHCGAVEIFVGRNAQVNYAQVQRWNHQVWNFSSQRAIVGRDAEFRWITGALGSRVSKLNQVSVLEGAGCRVEMLGLTFTHARQHVDIHTYQEHKAPHTTSDLLYKTVLKNQSQTVWSGMIYVHPEGQHTNAYQKNDNLVLNKRAHADTIPGLEIEANEVRCTHGATAGSIDTEQVFYLMSRGLSYDQAEEVIVAGFFEPAMGRIPLESVRDQLQQSVTHKLAV